MTSRFLPLLLAAASGAFACAASTRCVPDLLPGPFAVVEGDWAQKLVAEFRFSAGCVDFSVDSVVRRAPDSLAPPSDREGSASEGSAAVTVHARRLAIKRDSAAGAACAKLRGERLLLDVPVSPGSTIAAVDESTGVFVPARPVAADPDSLFLCLDGSCQKVAGRRVADRPGAEGCLEGALPPIGRDSAWALVSGRLAAAPEIVRLDRPRVLRAAVVCRELVAARAVSLAADTRIRDAADNFTDWGEIPRVVDWRDPSISPRLVLPSSFNASDYWDKGDIAYQVQVLRGLPTRDYALSWTYPSGLQTWQYRGTESRWSGCLRIPSDPVVGDSLRLGGTSFRLDNGDCPRRDVDVWAGSHDSWIFAPDQGSTWAASFRHGANLDNGASWPVDGDSVLVRGWRFPVSALLATVSVDSRRTGRSGLRVVGAAGGIAVELDARSQVVLAAPDGRILSRRSVEAGRSFHRLPAGYHGTVLVRAGSESVRLVAP